MGSRLFLYPERFLTAKPVPTFAGSSPVDPSWIDAPEISTDNGWSSHGFKKGWSAGGMPHKKVGRPEGRPGKLLGEDA
jgi:hypothetical protein